MEQICCRMCEKPLSPNRCSNQCPETFIEKFQNNQTIMFLPSVKCEDCDQVFTCTGYKESPLIEIENKSETIKNEIERLRSLLD